MEDIKAFQFAKRRMLKEQIIARGVKDEKVLRAIEKVPRHLFVDEALQDQAYSDYPVGIGEGQTISQPYIVARMTELLGLKGGEKVLEIGTGCGYQTAVLAEIAGQVYTIERIRSLGFRARKILKHLAYRNIVLRIGDGSDGWTEQKPFDAILIAAGSPSVPDPLMEQLAEGGRMVVPVGKMDEQVLTRVTRCGGSFVRQRLEACRFVKLVGRHGWFEPSRAGDQFTKRSIV